MTGQTETPFSRTLHGGRVEPLPPALVPSRSALVGARIRLQPMEPQAHLEDLYAASHLDDEGRSVWEYLPEGPWPDRAAYAAHLRANAANLERIFYALCPLPGNRAAGQASFMDIAPLNGVIEIGYIWFAPVLQRTAAATEAMLLMLDHAMTDLRYRRIQWRCNALNERSRAAARRLGFRYEGTFHNHMIYKGLNRDTAWYSILDSEWPAIRQNLLRWLSAENFDAQGRAKHSLTKMNGARGQDAPRG